MSDPWPSKHRFLKRISARPGLMRYKYRFQCDKCRTMVCARRNLQSANSTIWSRMTDEESDTSGKVGSPPSWFSRIHPLGWVAAIYGVVAIVLTVLGSEFLLGSLTWQWLVIAAVVAASFSFPFLDKVRQGIERISDVSAAIAWRLAWVVFALQFFNVVTRYTNSWFERDILFGEITSLAWMSFGMIFLIGVNYGVKAGINPRIDFWWANFSKKTKAWLDFVLHSFLLLPFILMGFRLLRGYAAISLGQKRSGDWPSGWRVWETWEKSSDAAQLPVGPIQAFILVAFGLWGLQVLAETIKTGFIIIGRDDLGQLAESDVPLRVE